MQSLKAQDGGPRSPYTAGYALSTAAAAQETAPAPRYGPPSPRGAPVPVGDHVGEREDVADGPAQQGDVLAAGAVLPQRHQMSVFLVGFQAQQVPERQVVGHSVMEQVHPVAQQGHLDSRPPPGRTLQPQPRRLRNRRSHLISIEHFTCSCCCFDGSFCRVWGSLVDGGFGGLATD
ncbi:hypothetical protein [Streptomyces sp. NPDC060031]|uniref:hypothetical protein n=1 Tax=Streptomyces sp. NPDC060031 TaxID=3347043 RepID=UPI0036C9ED0B